MQRLRRILPVLVVVALVVTLIGATGGIAYADTATVANQLLVASPGESIRAYTKQMVKFYPSSDEIAIDKNNTNLTESALEIAPTDEDWAEDNMIGVVAAGTTADYGSAKSEFGTITLYQLADGVDKDAISALFGLPVNLTVDTKTNKVTKVEVNGTLKIITSDRADSVYRTSGESQYFIDGVHQSGLNSAGRRFTIDMVGSTTGGLVSLDYTATINSGVNYGLAEGAEGWNADYGVNEKQNTARYDANKNAPDLLYIVDTNNDGIYDWTFLRPMAKGTISAISGAEIQFDSEVTDSILYSNGLSNNWMTDRVATTDTVKTYVLNGKSNTGAAKDVSYYVTMKWGAHVNYNGTNNIRYELFEVGNSVADKFATLKLNNEEFLANGTNPTAADFDATVTVYGVAEAIPTITSVTVENGVATVTGTYLGETITGTVELPVAEEEKVVTQTYFQITAGTTAESEKTSIRLVAGVNSLNYGRVGFIFSFTDAELNPETLAVLEWTAATSDGTTTLYKATSGEHSYFKISTNTVYESVTANGEVVTASELGAKYVFACTIVNVGNVNFSNVFNTRTFCSQSGVEEYQDVKGISINQLIELDAQ